MKIFSDRSSENSEETALDGEPVSTIPVAKREVVIDMLRGFAVLVMVITHVIAIVYAGGNGTSQSVYYIGLFGGIFSFTAFLFISGVSTFFSALKHDPLETEEDKKKRTKKKIGRIIKLLISYYIIATGSIFVNTTLYSFPPSFSWVQNIVSTLFFTIIPAFTEFLIPLLLFSLTVLFFPKFYKFLLKTPLFGLFFMSVIYGIGTLISQIDLQNDNLNTLKGILGGQIFVEGSLHTFPLFQYFPIFLLGIYLGKYYYHNQELRKRIKLNFIWLILFGAITAAGTLAYPYLRFKFLFLLPDIGRFPPSITFLSLSLLITLVVLFIFNVFSRIIPGFIKNIFNYFGVNAIEALVFHTSLLFAYQYITTSPNNPHGIKHNTLTDVIIIYIAVLFLSAILISIKNYVKKWTLDNKDSETVWWFFTERAVSSVVLVLLIGFVATTVYQDTFVKNASADTNSTVFKKRLIRDEDQWWNHDFTTYRTVSIKNEDSALPMFAGIWVTLEFNMEDALKHGTLVNSDGNDLRLVFFDKENGTYLELPFFLDKSNSSKAQISFKLLENVNPGEMVENYYLYYGNDNVAKAGEPLDKYTVPPIKNGVIAGAEISHAVLGQVNRKWFLKGDKNSNQELTIKADIESSEISNNSIVTYSILGTNKSGRMTKLDGRKYQASVKVSDLDVGTYRVQAAVTDADNSLKVSHTQNLRIYVSYPLYVSWTFDWEGWDVGQDNLDAIANIENTYKMSTTHFFNPRIYVEEQSTQNDTIGTISPERATYLTDWMKARQKNNGDEVGMHMHMWQDMVKAAGITPRSTPVISGTYGSDVPTYVYREDELEQIFRWGKNKLIENGLGTPISYRTGAWMSGTNVLEAAQNNGFLIDSSGRTGGKVNAKYSSSTLIPWTLSDTTYPFLPNKNDINKWDASLSNRFNIWEFSNNGADSYWFSKEDLIKRFDDNFSDKNAPISHPQSLVYLTHPHWFVSVDKLKIIALFDYISKYNYGNDKGPVIFDTLRGIYSQWDTTRFTNGN